MMACDRALYERPLLAEKQDYLGVDVISSWVWQSHTLLAIEDRSKLLSTLSRAGPTVVAMMGRCLSSQTAEGSLIAQAAAGW
jgi:hypothetical protein